jgi:para-nitrobenzyl esterase
MGNLRFGPIRDGIFLPIDLDKAFSERKVNQVDFLGGWVTGDGVLFGTQTATPEEFIKIMNERYGKRAAKLLTLLPHENSEEASNSLTSLNLISFAILSPYRLSKYNSKPSYIYEFSHVPVEKPGFPDYGAFHTSEVPYALHTLHLWDRPWQALDITLEDKMSNYWINFIKSGNPNGPNLAYWEPYHSGFSLELGDSIQGKSNLYKDILEVLARE